MMRKILFFILLIIGLSAIPSFAGTVRMFEDVEMQSDLSIRGNVTVDGNMVVGANGGVVDGEFEVAITIRSPENEANAIYTLLPAWASKYPNGLYIENVGISGDLSGNITSVTFEEWADYVDSSPSTIETLSVGSVYQVDGDGTMVDPDIAPDALIRAHLTPSGAEEVTLLLKVRQK